MAQLAPLIPYITAGATVLSGFASMQATQYQAAIAENNAKLLEQQAERENFAANQDLQSQDEAARAEIAALMAQMDASGLRSDTGTLLLRRQSAYKLAARDRERLAQKRDIQLENTKRQASSTRAEAKALKRNAGLGLLTTALSIPTSFLSSASAVNEYNRGRLGLSNPSYG